VAEQHPALARPVAGGEPAGFEEGLAARRFDVGEQMVVAPPAFAHAPLFAAAVGLAALARTRAHRRRATRRAQRGPARRCASLQ
jgi:glutathione S-transferase